MFPIKHTLTGINARGAMSLPLSVYRHGANHLDPKVLLTVDSHPSAHISCIHQMLSGWDIGLMQLLLNGFRHRLIRDGGQEWWPHG